MKIRVAVLQFDIRIGGRADGWTDWAALTSAMQGCDSAQYLTKQIPRALKFEVVIFVGVHLIT
jgi:hypothetical protein